MKVMCRFLSGLDEACYGTLLRETNHKFFPAPSPLRGGLGRGVFIRRNREQRDFARQLLNDAFRAERRLWHFLRAGKLGVKFRRQAAIGAYIDDFVCFSHRLIVELDGPQHVEEKGPVHDAPNCSARFAPIPTYSVSQSRA